MPYWPYRFNSIRALGFLLMTLPIFFTLYFTFAYLMTPEDWERLQGLLDIILYVGTTSILIGSALASIEKK